jgi:hypothetical protein
LKPASPNCATPKLAENSSCSLLSGVDNYPQMTHSAKGGRVKRRWRFRGICADARTLGVHRNSLYKVLAGIWKLKNLAARYAALKADQAKVAKTTN